MAHDCVLFIYVVLEVYLGPSILGKHSSPEVEPQPSFTLSLTAFYLFIYLLVGWLVG